MRKYFFILMLSLGSPTFCQVKNPDFQLLLDSLYQQSVPLLSVKEFIHMNKNEILYLLDTREQEEYEVSHIKNARQVGYFWFDMRNVYDIPPDANIVVYCSVGNRSEKIGEKLQEAGYTRVYNLYGGIFEWVNQRQPVYKSNGVQTSEIHTFRKDWEKWLNRGTFRN